MNEASDSAFIGELCEVFELEHTLILTPNQRIAQALQQQRDLIELQYGKTSWLSPPVMTMTTWLQRLWDDATAAGLEPCQRHWVLSPAEELELWRNAMLASLDTEFIAPESAAQQLMQAWQLLCNWRVDVQSSHHRMKFQLNDNGMFFLKVCDRVLAECHRRAAVCTAQLADLLSELESPLSGTVLLYGFEELIPAHRYLFNQWQTDCRHVQLKTDSCHKSEPLHTTRFPDQRAELLAAAQWAHNIVTDDEAARVAVIVPQLDVRRAQVEHCFQEVFTPQAVSPFVQRQVPPFNISAGDSLAATPVVRSALALLNCVLRPVPSATLPQLLYSPFYAHFYASNKAALYKLEHRLRAYGDSELSSAVILREAEYLCANEGSEHSAGGSCIGVLVEALSGARRFSREQHSQRFDNHLQCFQQQLAAFGWPGTRSVDSVEYQQLVAFGEALQSCRQLAHLRFAGDADITARQALKLIQDVLQRQVFQPQTSDSRVQILGLLEGAGLPFTHVRLCDFSLGQWPANPSPSAFIPFSLQRELRMPHCDAQRETEFSQRLLQRYQQQSHFLDSSFAAHDGHSDVLPSTLLSEQVIETIETSAESPDDSRQPATEPVAESASPELVAVPLSDDEDFRATTSVLTDQAACAFRAFARHRLQIRPFEPAILGLDGRERGIILHDAMESFWRETGDQLLLKSVSQAELEARIERAISAAIANAKRRLGHRGSVHYLGVESIRLGAVIAAWVQHELQREPFEVLELESAFDTEIAGQEARLRIDRIDLLSDGSLLLLEYKSGAVNEKDAMQAPLLAPQLALYLLRYQPTAKQMANGGAICRVDDEASAWISAGRAKYTGMPLQRRLLKWEQVEEDRAKHWSEQLDLWRREISRIEQSFIAGDAITNPAKGAQTCRQCDYASVCRYAIDGAGA